MAQQRKKRGLWERLAFGSEKDDGYARGTLPTNRWELFWDIFKSRFGKLILLNLLMILFLLPIFLLIFLRYVALTNLGASYPFMQGFGVGYQAPSSVAGLPENIILNVNSLVFLLMPIAMMIGAIGFSGGFYVMRNMVWTEGIFVANDFWRGIRQNIKQILLICVCYSIVFYASIISISLSNQAIAILTEGVWMVVIAKILSYIFLGIATIMAIHMMTMCVTYELKFKALIKNAFLFATVLLPQNLFFIVLGLVPFIALLFGGIFLIAGVILIILIGFSLFLLVWTDYCQWVFDKFINEKAGYQKNKGIYAKVKATDSQALKQYAEQMAMFNRSEYSKRPIKPITDDLKVEELPTSFNRNDIEKLQQSKQAIYDDHAKYVEEHKDDPQYQKTEEDKNLEKAREDREKRIEKAKRELAKRNKK